MSTDFLDGLELERYRRHLSLPQFGVKGQLRLKQASVLVVGVGGLGSVSSLYLAAAGVGKIGLVDDDQVSLDNLPRQVLYQTDEIGGSKCMLAAQRLMAHNPGVDCVPYVNRLNEGNARKIIEGYDLVVDGTDNLETRMVINQICVALKKPFVFGAVNHFDGQVSFFDSSQGPCLACLFPPMHEQKQPRTPEQLAIMNTVPGVIGVLQATEAIKWIIGLGHPLLGQLLIYNALTATFDRVTFEKNPQCPVCGEPSRNPGG